MKQLKVGLIVLSATVTGITTASATTSGSTLGYRTSGTVVLNFDSSNRPTGQWFSTITHGVVFSVAFTDTDGPSVLTFSGEFGKPQITGTSFVLFTNGADVAGRTFTAVKGACSF